MQARSIAISATATLATLLAGLSLAQAQVTDPDAACGASGVTGADAGAPCFTNVSDILGGQRYLLRDDDLLVTFLERADGKDAFVSLPLHTSELKSTPDSETTFTATYDCPGAPPEDATRLGRVYALPYDMMVTYVTQNFASGCSQALFVYDPVEGAILHGPFGGFPAIEPRLALFDANRDGYDDILWYRPGPGDDPLWSSSPSAAQARYSSTASSAASITSAGASAPTRYRTTRVGSSGKFSRSLRARRAKAPTASSRCSLFKNSHCFHERRAPPAWI